MSTLRSVVESLRAESLADAPDALIEERFDEVHRGCEQLELERLRTIREVDRRRLFEREGNLSCAAWLVARYTMSWKEAGRKVRLARSLERMPVTRRAIEDGAISMSSAHVLADAEHAHPEAFPDAEERLVKAACIHTIAELQQVAAFWCHQVETGSSGSAKNGCGRTARSLRLAPSAGWCAWTAISIPRTARRCSRP